MPRYRIAIFILLLIIPILSLGINHNLEQKQRKLQIARIILRSSCNDYDDLKFALELGRYLYYRGGSWEDWRDTYVQMKSHTQDAIQLGKTMKQKHCFIQEYNKPTWSNPEVEPRSIASTISELKMLLPGITAFVSETPPISPDCGPKGIYCGPRPDPDKN